MISEVQKHTTKTVQVTGALNGMVWKNKDNMNRYSKIKIYKTTIRPILTTYAGETRAVTQVTKPKIRTVKMKILRNILRITLRDRQKNVDIRDNVK